MYDKRLYKLRTLSLLKKQNYMSSVNRYLYDILNRLLMSHWDTLCDYRILMVNVQRSSTHMALRLTSGACGLQLYGYTERHRVAASCQQVAASLLNSLSCSKSVKIRLVATRYLQTCFKLLKQLQQAC